MNEILNVEQKLQRAHVWLMKSPQFALYSGLLLMGERVVTKKVPTAGTDGYNTFYNPEFAGQLSEAELRGLVLHETMHKAFKHFSTWGELAKINGGLLNKAMDYVINIIIEDAGVPKKELTLPQNGCIDARFRGMSTGEVFKILLKEQEGSHTEKDDGFDFHDWGGAKELENSELGDVISNEIDTAIRMGVMAEKMRGGGKGVGMYEIEELLAPVVRWEDELLEFVNSVSSGTDMSTWRKPARKWVHQDVYMPSCVSESIGSLVVAIDTSGSISAKELNQFLSELVYVCNTCSPERVDLVYWGSSVVGHEVYEPGEYALLCENTKPLCGGGTNISCVSDFLLTKKISPQAVIVLTDGYLGNDWGTWGVPTLWGIITKDIVSPVGKSIYMEM